MLGLNFPSVMGVLNVTPDSFSDGGRFANKDRALRQARQMIADGAAILDVGGESTRPGAAVVSEQRELDRVIPVIEAIRAESEIPISIDSSKPGVMRAAVAAGAVLINDVRALQADGAMATAVDLQAPVCLMHMQGDPRSMQIKPHYVDVVAEVTQFLEERVAECVAAGLRRELLLVDPGFGFGKTAAQNVELLANLRQLQRIGCPVLIGISRKSTLGAISGRDVDDRMAASIAAAVFAVLQGAQIIRAHDVKETVDAIRVAECLAKAGKGQ
ncbi:MAG: dihydropteroate synthase [Gammaproteobacteria bacterium]|nr:dihydropteroate synthase [Gammaproteobacteria bacterium]MDH5303020.1 dihydropteroate synthase [Gammaproteobacteria bacterium]MDH5321233.1 dihydropteroate synthase [Gammaproteobacteria bacterium]